MAGNAVKDTEHRQRGHGLEQGDSGKCICVSKRDCSVLHTSRDCSNLRLACLSVNTVRLVVKLFWEIIRLLLYSYIGKDKHNVRCKAIPLQA